MEKISETKGTAFVCCIFFFFHSSFILSVVRSGGGKSSVYVIFLFIVFSKENKATVWKHCLSLVMVSYGELC